MHAVHFGAHTMRHVRHCLLCSGIRTSGGVDDMLPSLLALLDGHDGVSKVWATGS